MKQAIIQLVSNVSAFNILLFNTRTPIQPFVWTLKKKRTEKKLFMDTRYSQKNSTCLKRQFHKKEVDMFVSRMNEKKMLYSFNGEKSHSGKEA